MIKRASLTLALLIQEAEAYLYGEGSAEDLEGAIKHARHVQGLIDQHRQK
jgi:hypothetical protein